MRAKHARQIRHGIWVARTHAVLQTTFRHPIKASAVVGLSDLEYRAYHREFPRHLAKIRNRLT